MSLKVKSGNPEGVHENIPGGSSRAIVKEFDESEGRSRPADVTIEAGTTEIFKKHPTTRKPGYARERVYTDERAETFQRQMEEGLTEETNQGNPFDPPAVGSTKPRTLSESMQEVVLRFKLMMVAIWLPSDYEVVQKQPLVDVKQFIEEARLLWDSYEPLLGRRNTTTVLQVEAPPELEEE